MEHDEIYPAIVLHWNYRGFTEFPLNKLRGEEAEVTDIYLKENLISRIPNDIGKLECLQSLYLSGNDITELPREISKLRCLKCLDVSGNRLRFIPEEIGEVRGLKFLILDENELEELPLRISELRSLRYLSVCDNKLQWLPQRPVYNYHHCEFRFWRNKDLKTIPYSLWYHMFRGQQTRCLNIGCLSVAKPHQISKHNSYRLKINIETAEQVVSVNFPPKYQHIMDSTSNKPPSLLELCKRALHQIICDAVKKLNVLNNNSASNTCPITNHFDDYNSARNLENVFENINISTNDFDLNGNNVTAGANKIPDKPNTMKKYYVASDLVANHYSFLPSFVRNDLCSGPISRCENKSCNKPIFDYVYYDFCTGQIKLIDSMKDIVLNATFCSNHCAYIWRREKSNIIPWTLVKNV